MAAALVVADSLTKEFRQRERTVQALRGVSFHVDAGEVYGLLGANGAGKTTTLRILLGLIPATSGDAVVCGASVRTQPREVKRRLGLASTSAGLYPWHSVRELLTFFADAYGVPPAESAARIEDLGRRFGLNALWDRRCGALSTGQAQRVQLARTLIHDPAVVLLDEPTRGLDVSGSKAVFDYVAVLRDLGKAVLVCTHGLDEAERLCDRFGLLHLGRMRAEGTMDELRRATGRDRLVEMFHDFLAEPAAPVEAAL